MSDSMSTVYAAGEELERLLDPRGVARSPSRSGFSPSSARIWRTRSCMAVALHVIVCGVSVLDAGARAR